MFARWFQVFPVNYFDKYDIINVTYTSREYFYRAFSGLRGLDSLGPF